MEHNSQVAKRITELTKIKRQAEKALLPLSECRVHIKKIGKSYSLYKYSKNADGGGSEKYINRSDPQFKKLLNAEYCRRLIPLLNSEIKALEQLSNSDEQKKYSLADDFPQSMREFIRPLVKSPLGTAREWAAEDYSRNSFPFNENAVFINAKGEQFRSKAEYIIASVLTELGLPYRYECEYTAGGRHYFPDFTVMHPNTCELYYIEYFGMMSDPDYASGAIRKISFYQSAPDAARFIYLFEAHDTPMDVDRVRNLLASYFL